MAAPAHTFETDYRRSRGPWPWLLAAVAAVVLAAVGTGLVRAVLWSGKPLPGTQVAGVSVEGLSGPALEHRIAVAVRPKLRRPVTVLVGSGRVDVVPAEVLAFDVVQTAALARQEGRGSFWRQATALLWPTPARHDVQPVLRVRAQAAATLREKLAGFGKPARDAGVRIVAGVPEIVPGRAGTVPNLAPLIRQLRRSALGVGELIYVSFVPSAPTIGRREAAAGLAQAAALLGGPVALVVDGRPAGKLEPPALAAALRMVPVNGALVPRLTPGALGPALAARLGHLHKPGVDARLVVTGKTVQIIPSKPGLDVAPGKAAAAVLAAMRSPERTAQLALEPVEAAFSTRKAEALGIRDQVSTFTTDMGPSSAQRIHNVQLMADLIDGTIVRPGQVFSFNKVVGPRTVERGFQLGQALYGTVAVASIGGGVCQTATTLFNNAFDLGLPILARQNHSTFIAHYPTGRDATVSWGGPDFVFRNDLKKALLIKTSYTRTTLTFSFYGTPQGRRVVATTGPRINIVPPQVHYALDLNARPGSVTTAPGSGAAGFDVVVSRKVIQRGKVIRRDSFRSHYLDVGPTKIYGPGQTVPRPYFVIPKEV